MEEALNSQNSQVHKIQLNQELFKILLNSTLLGLFFWVPQPGPCADFGRLLYWWWRRGWLWGLRALNARLLARRTAWWLWETLRVELSKWSSKWWAECTAFVFLEVFFSLFFLGGMAIYEILLHYFGMLFLPLRVTSEGWSQDPHKYKTVKLSGSHFSWLDLSGSPFWRCRSCCGCGCFCGQIGVCIMWSWCGPGKWE